MKNTIFLLFLLCSTFFNYAQVELADHLIFKDDNGRNFANGPVALFSTDLDNDGDLDVLSAAYINNQIAWYENLNGKGIFGDLQVISSNAKGARYVSAADIDNDGDMDVLSTSHDDNKIAWYENIDGKGGFGEEQIISIETSDPQTVYASDLDGDGDLDLIAASYARLFGSITWYENRDGKGNFGPAKIIINDIGSHSVFPSDFNGDGTIDILVAYRDELHWYKNNGKGDFEQIQKIHSYRKDFYRSIYASDIDSDGDFDILFAYGSTMSWCENLDGKGAFGIEQIIKDNSRSYKSVHASDLDGDGDIDVISASGRDNKIAWFENTNGEGNFGNENIISTSALNASMVDVSDIDGDGDMDLLSASYDDDKLAWYPNTDGRGVFSFPHNIAANISWINSIGIADLNNDSKSDIFFSSNSGVGEKVSWYSNSDGNGTFDTQYTVGGTVRQDPESVIAIDIDNDGDMDLLNKYSSGNTRVVWYENLDGKGYFGEESIIDNMTVNHLLAKDIDDDGDIDVIVYSPYDNSRIIWYENEDSKGGFGKAKTLFEFNMARDVKSIRIDDLDIDGDLDIIFSFRQYGDGENFIFWSQNVDGKGTFSTSEYLTKIAGISTSLRTADIDKDGDVDIVSSFDSNGTDGGIQWFENKQGIFDSSKTIQDKGVISFEVDDFDLDGDLDIISQRVGYIVWYENTGGGNFSLAKEIFNLQVYLKGKVSTGDIDGDGDVDILYADRRKLIWFENLLIDIAKITIDDVTVNENDGIALIKLILDKPVDGGFNVSVSTEDDTATIMDDDYEAITNKIISFVGNTKETHTITVNIREDSKVETDERIKISMSKLVVYSPSSRNIDITHTGRVTIKNNDTASITLTNATGLEASKIIDVIATLDSPVQGGFTVDVNSLDGTAKISTDDYMSVSNQALSFKGIAGETQNISVNIIDDSIFEETESLEVLLSNINQTNLANNIIIKDAATVTILDDDELIITKVDVPTDGNYGIGSYLDFIVNFNSPVSITGVPSISLMIGDTSVEAKFTEILNNVNRVAFRYTVKENELDTDGVVLGNTINLNGGTIKDTFNKDASLILKNIKNTTNVLVDAISPTVIIKSSEINPSYATSIKLTIIFSKTVTGFVEDDIVITNGSILDFKANGAIYNLVIKPAISGQVNVNINYNVAVDASMNPNKSAQFSIIYDSDLRINDELLSPEFNIYPVPATNSITVDINNASLDINRFEIFDVEGKMITSEKLNENSDTHTIDISKISSGLYMIYFYGKKEIKKKKIIIQ
ncbi:FG-GAP-like repeat-containing protein [Aquimarina muelleri]|uniref:FG-GAP-like repeat-containing protein n=1 Tax=Aquimarina muelleri TaxID=279356 RepID=UPI003F688177